MSLRKLVCTAAVATFLVIAAPPAGAAEQSQQDGIDALPFTTPTEVWATRSLSAQPGQQTPQFLRLDIAQLTPRFVTSDSPGTVKITGKIVNTNFNYITQKLEDVGLSVVWETTVGDDRNDLLLAFQLAGSRADAVIVNGGLGPTVDDLSQEIAAPSLAAARLPDRRHAIPLRLVAQPAGRPGA